MNKSLRPGATLMVVIAGMLVALSGWVVPPGTEAAQQPDRDIRIPENLPEPVGPEMRVEAEDLDAALAEADVVLLDVREPWELAEYGTRAGYINIPLGELESRLDELPLDKTILTA